MFIGSQLSFSDSLIAATNQGLGQITSDLAHSFHEFRNRLTQTETPPSVVVLDEATLRSMSEDDLDFLMSLDGLSIGIAYRDLSYITARHREAGFASRSVSFFPLDVRLDIWLSIVTLIARGGCYVCPNVIAGPARQSRSLNEYGLTQRQIDVLQLVANGQSNKCIAAKLGLSIHTVKLHLRNASQRLGAHNRTEAAMRYRAFQS